MENSLIIGLLLTNLTTNWVDLGTLGNYKIQEGFLETNYSVRFTLNDKEHKTLIYKDTGPSIGLRKQETGFLSVTNLPCPIWTNWLNGTNLWIKNCEDLNIAIRTNLYGK